MGFLKNIQNGSCWNIGFCGMTPEELVSNKCLKTIQWMTHPYRDRFFADPFILKVTDTEIVVFAEEYVFDHPPGVLVELVLERDSKQLRQRYEILRLPTHLSYPAIIRHQGEVYVYPENGQAGELTLYRFDEVNHRLVDPICILKDAVADSTIYESEGGQLMMVATRYPDNQQNAYLYHSLSLKGGFEPVSEEPFQTSGSCSRPAGDFFKAYGQLYRPAQNCADSYGASISIMAVDLSRDTETAAFEIVPHGGRYPLGLHTINFCGKLCVIDGLGYFYPLLGKLYASPSVAKVRCAVKKMLGR